MQIKTDDNPKALDLLTGFLHFLEGFHSAVFMTVSRLPRCCPDSTLGMRIFSAVQRTFEEPVYAMLAKGLH